MPRSFIEGGYVGLEKALVFDDGKGIVQNDSRDAQLDRIELKLDLLISLLMDDDEEVQLPEGYSLEDNELGFDEPVTL